MILNLSPLVRLLLTALVAAVTVVSTALPAPYQGIAQVLLVVLAAVGIVPPTGKPNSATVTVVRPERVDG